MVLPLGSLTVGFVAWMGFGTAAAALGTTMVVGLVAAFLYAKAAPVSSPDAPATRTPPANPSGPHEWANTLEVRG